MTALVTVAVVWLAALLCVPSAVARRRWALAVGVLAAAGMLTLQAPGVYLAVDPLLGGVNVTNLLFRLCGLVCIGAFGSMVAQAWSRRPVLLTRVIAALAGACCVLQTLLFAVNRFPAIDPHLARYSTAPSYVLYGSVLWVALLTLAVSTAVSSFAETRGRPWNLGRVGVMMIGAGALVGVAWCVQTLINAVRTAMIGGQVWAGEPALAQTLVLVTAVAVLGGLAVLAAPGLADHARFLWLQLASRHLWREAVVAAPEVVLPRPPRLAPRVGRREAYRRWVEIEDAIRLGRIVPRGKQAKPLARMEAAFGAGSNR